MKPIILHIDDNQDDLELTHHALSDEFDFLSAITGVEGVQIAQEITPDLILLDNDISGERGLEILKKLKSHRDTKEIPVIIYSGVWRDDDENTFLDYGVDDFVRKETSSKLLRNRIYSALKTTKEKAQIAIKKEQKLFSEIESRLNAKAKSKNIDPEIISDLLQEINIYQAELDAQNDELQLQQQVSDELLVKLSDLENNLPVGYARYSIKDYTIFEANQVVRRVLQIPLNQHDSLSLLIRLRMTFEADILELSNWLSSNSDFSSMELKAKSSNQWIILSKSVIDETSALLGVVDITKTKTAETERLELALKNEQLAKEANLNKSNFLANMSHELRTPLHAISSFSQLGIKKFTENEAGLTYFQNINKSSKRLANLINDLLDLSKMEAGKLVLNLRSDSFTKTIASAIRELQVLADDKGTTIDFNPAKDHVTVFDQDLLYRVIINLISNAIKYSPENTRVTIAVSETDNMIRCAVTDQGIGIPNIELESIFDPFTQSTHTTTGAGGTGLGLAICKEIIDLHSGKIWAKSPPEDQEKGSQFILEIPRIKTLNLK